MNALPSRQRLRTLVMKAMRNCSCRCRRGKAEARHQPGMFESTAWDREHPARTCPVLNEGLNHFAPGTRPSPSAETASVKSRSSTTAVPSSKDAQAAQERDPSQSEVTEGKEGTESLLRADARRTRSRETGKRERHGSAARPGWPQLPRPRPESCLRERDPAASPFGPEPTTYAFVPRSGHRQSIVWYIRALLIPRCDIGPFNL